MKGLVGIATIGQSPRVDVVPQMAAQMGLPRERVVERGALDGLSPQEIADCRPGPREFHLVTRLRDGSEVVVAKERILILLARAVGKLAAQGTSLIILLCNGEFPDFAAPCLVLEPQRLVNHCLAALMRPGLRLGVVVPVEQQADWVRRGLGLESSQLEVAVCSPYEGGDRLGAVCLGLEAAGCDLAVLYCMGFSASMGSAAREKVTMPIMVSSSLVARVAGELVG